MTSRSSSATLPSWDPMDLFDLMNSDNLAITCVGNAPSCGRRCRNVIAQHNIQAAKETMKRIVRPNLADGDMKALLFDLAGSLLCRKNHQNQAEKVSDEWFRTVQEQVRGDEPNFSDTSDDDSNVDSDDGNDSSSSSSSEDEENDQDESATNTHQNMDALDAERRRRLNERLQRERDELLATQHRRPLNQLPRTSPKTPLAPAYPPTPSQSGPATRPSGSSGAAETRWLQRQAEEETKRKIEQYRQEKAYCRVQRERAETRGARRRARAEEIRQEQARREEAQKQAEREKAEREAEAERERLRRENVEKARRVRQQQTKQQSMQPWERAWSRYEQAWSEVSQSAAQASFDVRLELLWPTQTGSCSSCCEADVKAFFYRQPGDINRKIVRRQALRWHPDRMAKFFVQISDPKARKELVGTVKMISQVINGIMGTCAA